MSSACDCGRTPQDMEPLIKLFRARRARLAACIFLRGGETRHHGTRRIACPASRDRGSGADRRRARRNSSTHRSPGRFPRRATSTTRLTTLAASELPREHFRLRPMLLGRLLPPPRKGERQKRQIVRFGCICQRILFARGARVLGQCFSSQTRAATLISWASACAFSLMRFSAAMPASR